ncbi:MAG: DNA mismatch repair endonuclease MutL [Desulfamplus sp.]|nr:DNA mismatch repair endonuclease MutL [Desulfamplus sp.]
MSEGSVLPEIESILDDIEEVIPEVRILPEIIANKIAAGEVVERPASVVKELIENSLDARAGRITIEVEKGGSDLIRVSDDGHGMSREDALTATQRYATSKIVSDEDLFSIKTFGFRGEALPSMASVSNFTLITRKEQETSGTKIDISGGKLHDISEIGAPKGTMIEIKNLYFNTPARRKFLKTTNTEMGHISSSVAGFALSSPNVQFHLVHNGRTVKHYSDSDDLVSRICMVLGTEAGDLYSVNSTETGCSTEEETDLYTQTDSYAEKRRIASKKRKLSITGYITKPSVSRNSSGNILLFVNKRMVSDRAILSAILKGYKGWLMKGQFPMAVLFIEIPFDEVDVNVHPAKLQVRFANQSLVFGAVVNAIHNALYHGEKKQHLSANGVDSDNNGYHDTFHPQQSYTLQPEQSFTAKIDSDSRAHDSVCLPKKLSCQYDYEPCQPGYEKDDLGHDISEVHEFSNNGHAPMGTTKNKSPIITTNSRDFHIKPIQSEIQRNSVVPELIDHSNGKPVIHNDSYIKSSESKTRSTENDIFQNHKLVSQFAQPERLGKIANLRIIGQFANTYIIAESRDEMVLIDQHAAHERVVYEMLKKRSEGFRPPSQDILVPEIIQLNYREAAMLEKMIPQLLNMGIELESFGGSSFAIKSVPAIIDDRSIKPMLLDMVGMMAESGLDGSREEEQMSRKKAGYRGGTDIGTKWLDSILILMACHSAVRANHALNSKEMEQLLADLEKCENPYHCPHGRPTIISFSEKELEQRFKRSGN